VIDDALCVTDDAAGDRGVAGSNFESFLVQPCPDGTQILGRFADRLTQHLERLLNREHLFAGIHTGCPSKAVPAL